MLFSYHSERMRGMDELFSSYFTSDPLLSLTDGSSAVAPRGTSRSRRGNRATDDWDLYGGSRDLMTRNDPFQSVNAMMRSMLGNMSTETMAVRKHHTCCVNLSGFDNLHEFVTNPLKIRLAVRRISYEFAIFKETCRY